MLIAAPPFRSPLSSTRSLTDVAEHVALGAADQRRAGEVGEQRDVDEQQGDEDPGRDQRQQDPAGGRPPAGAEVARGLEQVAVDRLHRGVDRDHRVGQVAGREHDDDRELAEQQRVDRRRRSGRSSISAVVDQALAPEQHPPGVDADHRVELVGEDEEEQQRRARSAPPCTRARRRAGSRSRAGSPSPRSRSGRSSGRPRDRAGRRATSVKLVSVQPLLAAQDAVLEGDRPASPASAPEKKAAMARHERGRRRPRNAPSGRAAGRDPSAHRPGHSSVIARPRRRRGAGSAA